MGLHKCTLYCLVRASPMYSLPLVYKQLSKPLLSVNGVCKQVSQFSIVLTLELVKGEATPLRQRLFLARGSKGNAAATVYRVDQKGILQN